MHRRTLLKGAALAAGAALATSALAQDTPKPGSGYARVNGLDMYYEIHGQGGTPLVLLHGAFSAIGTSFGGILPELSTTRQVIAFELQGHGHTADIDRPLAVPALADDVAKALAGLGIGKVDVFGYSLGGAVALQLTVDHPELVRRAVFASVAYAASGYPPGFVEAMQGIKPEMLMGSPWQLEYAEVAPHPENFAGLVARVRDMMKVVPEVPEAAIRAITIPTLLIAGDADNATLEHTAAFYRLLGGGVPVEPMGTARAWLHILPGTSHAFVPDRADVINPMVERFLAADIPSAA